MLQKLITKELIKDYFANKFRGKHELLFVYYYDYFTQSPPNFHIFRHNIIEELSIEIRLNILFDIKKKYQSRPSTLAKVAHQKLLLGQKDKVVNSPMLTSANFGAVLDEPKSVVVSSIQQAVSTPIVNSPIPQQKENARPEYIHPVRDGKLTPVYTPGMEVTEMFAFTLKRVDFIPKWYWPMDGSDNHLMSQMTREQKDEKNKMDKASFLREHEYRRR